MNVFNRIVTSLLLILLIVAAVPFAVTPSGVAVLIAEQLLLVQPPAFSVAHLLIALACAIVVVICLLLLGREFRRPPRGTVYVAHGNGGSAELATDSVASRLKRQIEEVPQVQQALPLIMSRGGAVDVRLDVRTDHDVDVPAKAAEVDQMARQAIDQMGLKLNRLNVKIICAPAAR